MTQADGEVRRPSLPCGDNAIALRYFVIVLLQRDEIAVAPGIRGSALAPIARRGIAVLEAGDADVAAWVERLALQEAPSPEDGWRGAPGRRRAAADRLAEQLAARCLDRRTPAAAGALPVPAALAATTPEQGERVRGFRPKPAGAIAAVMAHDWATPADGQREELAGFRRRSGGADVPAGDGRCRA